MYKIILVDDEDEVREGIKQKISWSKYGFELVGDFDNGRDALEAIEQHRPDVIITDICMPFMDGLGLARAVMDRYRDMKVIIVTGYEDFEYAKQAITLKVTEYLLKPINAREFAEFLSKMKQDLDEEHLQKANLVKLRMQLNQSLPLLRERFLEQLVTTRMKSEEIENKLSYFHIPLQGQVYLALVIDIELEKRSQDLAFDAELLRFGAFNIVQEQLEKEQDGVVFQTRDGKIAAIRSGNSETLEVATQLLAEQVQSSLNKYLKLSSTIGIGRKYNTLQQIPLSFQEAVSSIEYRYLLGIDKVISIQDLEFGKGLDQAHFTSWEKQFISALKTGKASAVSEILLKWFQELKSNTSSIEGCRSSIYQLLVSLMNYVVDIGFPNTVVVSHNMFAEVATLKTLDEARHYLERTCHALILKLSEQRTTVRTSQMQAAEAYIRENYCNDSFSLNELCSHIFMSISYFSATFKQHTGETFIEYLTRLRLEKAKELLTVTQLKTYDIAARVGYADPQYFSVIFKRNVGSTPKEYRHRQKENLSL
ncbi:response regulator [Paenibacillus sp. FSL R5-0887]|jgi:two-component system response regulator YesN|uniref:response regulator n=1 Tax=Paenibacillus TaxID=44249 RepID=UPI0020BF23CD|nr:response regulator [Paenibacillus odorifer]